MTREFENLGIAVKGNSVQQKLECPNCIEIGKTNYKDKCLSINLNDGRYNCFKCGWSGRVGSQTLIYNATRK